VRDIREALREVPDALRFDPEPEDSGVGDDPGSQIPISDPDSGPGTWEMMDMPSDDESENGMADEPAVIVRVSERASVCAADPIAYFLYW
jgi:hypothetical protein